MAPDPTLASDVERDLVATELRRHAGDGRLTVDELEQRVAAALAARTRADLALLTSDLPRGERPPRSSARPRPRVHSAAVRTYLLVMVMLVAIWALTGAGYFWPIWPMLGWGLPLASGRSCHGRSRSRLELRPR